jgi:pectate lyase
MGFGRIKAIIRVLVIVLIILSVTPMISNALPAFPGAQGWGSDTTGGRSVSAKLYKVNTLSDGTNGSCSGNICTGTLRYALTASGPRIIIFTVGGTITLNSSIWISNPYFTVAGQTAPGGGILIRGPGNPEGYGAAIVVQSTHDVIVRGLKLRDTGDSGITVLGSPSPSYNVIVDHNSLSWNIDAMGEIWEDSTKITFSYNIFSEALANPVGYAQGVLVGTAAGCTKLVQDITLHHNLFSHNGSRNPLIKHDVGRNEIINNVIYHWDYAGIETYATSYIAKNVLVKKPGQTETSPRGIRVTSGGECPSLLQSGTVMVTHNIGPDRPTDTGDDWLAVDGGTNSYRTNSPPFTLWGMTEEDVSTVKATVLANAGAIIPYRDSVDTRIINDVNNLSGNFITSPSQVGGWPTIAGGTYPTDTDGDGMPDTWETARGLNPNDPSDWNKDRDGDGYLNIEEYINSFFPANVSAIVFHTPNPPTIIGIN